MTSPYGFARAVVLGVGEMLKELHQARLQRRRDVRPRVSRGGAYLALRPVTNVLLRDLNVSLIAEQMARGAPVIFCDFVDYDEVAHHAGPARPEAMQRAGGAGPGARHPGPAGRGGGARDYQLVVLSDHGQSQGATFRQRYGETLEEVVRDLLVARRRQASETSAATGDVEEWGRVNVLLTGVVGRTGPAAAATRAATRGRHAEPPARSSLGPADEEQRDVERTDPELVVVASGNLAMVYLTRYPGKLTLERARRPAPGPGARPGRAPGRRRGRGRHRGRRAGRDRAPAAPTGCATAWSTGEDPLAAVRAARPRRPAAPPGGPTTSATWC